MRVIAGLGNPGAEYEGSRHNIGFRVVAGLADGCGIRLSAGRGDFTSGSGRLSGRQVVLVQPLTYMNASGRAVSQVLEQTDSLPSELLVVCDDVDLPLGQLRLRPSGSDGGHRGLASIIDSLGTSDFARFRLGVGRPASGDDTADFVLDRFTEDEEAAVEQMVERAIEAIGMMTREGMEKAMTVFNRRIAPAEGGESRED